MQPVLLIRQQSKRHWRICQDKGNILQRKSVLSWHYTSKRKTDSRPSTWWIIRFGPALCRLFLLTKVTIGHSLHTKQPELRRLARWIETVLCPGMGRKQCMLILHRAMSCGISKLCTQFTNGHHRQLPFHPISPSLWDFDHESVAVQWYLLQTCTQT